MPPGTSRRTPLAVVASAHGRSSRLTGIAHLRGHETDRLAALVAEITRIGGLARQMRKTGKEPSCESFLDARPARAKNYGSSLLAKGLVP